MKKEVKLNLGAGPGRMEGFQNVDALSWNGNTDIIWDLTKTPYTFIEERSVDEIMAVEVLEHISIRKSDKVLREWYNMLKLHGKLTVQVPDTGKMMEYYEKGEICDCVPHKSKNWEGYKADPKCPKCQGRGKVNPNRWLFAFTGAQKYSYDFHRNVFTKEILEKNLKDVGFEKVEFIPNIYKLIVTAYKCT